MSSWLSIPVLDVGMGGNVKNYRCNFMSRNPARIGLSGHPHRLISHEKEALIVPDVSEKKSVTYADAGVDISRGDRAKERIKFLAQKTFNRNVLGGIGGFGALYRLDMQRWKNPILVSSADGVGTKLKIAFELGQHHTVGAGPRRGQE